MFFYSETSERSGGSVAPFNTWRANERYLEHYGNYLILDAMLKRPKDRVEAAQVAKELMLCERKLAYWTRHPNYEKAVCDRGIAELKRQWGRAA